MLIFGMFVAMLYVATGKTSWVVIGLTLAAIGVAAATSILPYVQARFTNWLYPFDPDTVDGSSYQLVSGIFGLAQGGLLGTGLGRADRASPLSQSDYIFPSLGEELGLIGVFAILCLYMVFTSRGIRIGIAGRTTSASSSRRACRSRSRCRCSSWSAASPAHPPHGTHDAVPRGRRIVAHRELDHRRASAAHLRCRALAPGGDRMTKELRRLASSCSRCSSPCSARRAGSRSSSAGPRREPAQPPRPLRLVRGAARVDHRGRPGDRASVPSTTSTAGSASTRTRRCGLP
jgi:hypothetical protein